MDTKTIKDSAGVNYTLSNHPMFQNCSCVSWQEGIRTFRYYWSMEEEPNPERWRSKSPLGIIGHDPEPPKFIGKGLDIILAKGETEVLNVLAIRPEFTQYGTSTPEYGGRRDHNDYNLSQDLSGLVRYADEPYGIYRILMEREKDPEKINKAKILFQQKEYLVKGIMLLFEAEERGKIKRNPSFDDFFE